MPTFKSFEEIVAWKKAHALAVDFYRITNTSALNHDFELRGQMRKSAISIPSNIAEGHERNSNRQFIYFLNVAKASAAELRAQTLLAFDLGYIALNQYDQLKNQLIEVSKLIASLMNYLHNYQPKPIKQE